MPANTPEARIVATIKFSPVPPGPESRNPSYDLLRRLHCLQIRGKQQFFIFFLRHIVLVCHIGGEENSVYSRLGILFRQLNRYLSHHLQEDLGAAILSNVGYRVLRHINPASALTAKRLKEYTGPLVHDALIWRKDQQTSSIALKFIREIRAMICLAETASSK